MKFCVACLRRWDGSGVPDYAEFCDHCFAVVLRGRCPAGWDHGSFLAPAGLWAPWPVVVCGQGYKCTPRPFSEAHPQIDRRFALSVLDAEVPL